ncbi:hypothetical protein P12x_000606 [Tundrisphaera lichenicola]|uniref:hypothetical protein n=1 Tax=Tundrisphaera lichenicola TaxID=2029860 RepID=UPI003EB91C1D
MLRPFPALALTSLLLMGIAQASGMLGPGRNHPRIGVLAIGATLAAYGLAFGQVRASARRVDRLAEGSGLPEWVKAQAEKNRRKARAYLPWGLGLVGISAGTGWLGGGGAHLAASASAIGFLAGASWGLVLLLKVQAGLLKDVERGAKSALPASDS